MAKFAFPWQRTSLTFDPDINPEGFDAKLSFDVHRGPIRSLTVQGMQLVLNEVKGGPDSYATGGNASARLEFGPWTASPSYTLLNWHLPDQLLQASAFAVSTTTGISSTGTSSGNVAGEGPGCATIVGGPPFRLACLPPTA